MILDEAAWLAICFSIFIFIAYRPVKKVILSFLDNRITQIRTELHAAEKAAADAERELKLLKEYIATSAQKQHDMVSVAKEEIEKIFDERCREFKKSLEYRENAARDSIKQMQKDAIVSVEKDFLTKVLSVVSDYFEKNGSSNTDLAILSSISHKALPKERQKKSPKKI